MANETFIEVYRNMLIDIEHGRNLEAHLADVEVAIKNLDVRICNYESSPELIAVNMKRLKNEIYHLKYQILEKL